LLLVAAVVVLAAGVGMASERRFAPAPRVARLALASMLYVFVPFVSFVNIAHLHVTTGTEVGIVLAYVAIGIDGVIAWTIGRRLLALPRPSLGALILCVVVVNTGYLGYPMAVAVLGSHALSAAIAYDQLVSGPMLFTIGFGIGAAFGTRGGEARRERMRSFLSRNPPLLAVIAGLIAPASAAPHALVSASHVVVDALLPLGFFAVGVTLSAERRAEHAPLIQLPDRRVIVAVLLRHVVPVTLLAGASATIVALPHAYLLQATMPTAVNSLVVGHAYGLDQRLIATVIMWSTAVVLVIGLLVTLL
jgi:malate permease and related proteins